MLRYVLILAFVFCLSTAWAQDKPVPPASSKLDITPLQQAINETLTRPIMEELKKPTGFSPLVTGDKRKRTMGFVSLRIDNQLFGGVQSASYVDFGAGILKRTRSMEDRLRVEVAFRKYTVTGSNSFGRLDVEYRF